jgi:hypothetical protein
MKLNILQGLPQYMYSASWSAWTEGRANAQWSQCRRGQPLYFISPFKYGSDYSVFSVTSKV